MKVVTLNASRFDDVVKDLCQKIDYEPDVIIGVLTGGGYLINSIRKQNIFQKAKISLIKLQRASTKKKEFSVVKVVLRTLPYFISNFLRVIESNRVRKKLGKIVKAEIVNKSKNLDLKENLNGKNVLIIDDAIDTGKTVSVLINSINSKFQHVKSINIAVISWTIENSIVKPDYYIYNKILVRFPWSNDYKGNDFAKQSFSS